MEVVLAIKASTLTTYIIASEMCTAELSELSIKWQVINYTYEGKLPLDISKSTSSPKLVYVK